MKSLIRSKEFEYRVLRIVNNVYMHNDPRGLKDYDSLYVANMIS